MRNNNNNNYNQIQYVQNNRHKNITCHSNWPCQRKMKKKRFTRNEKKTWEYSRERTTMKNPTHCVCNDWANDRF